MEQWCFGDKYYTEGEFFNVLLTGVRYAGITCVLFLFWKVKVFFFLYLKRKLA